jgi:hypothetical protein
VQRGSGIGSIFSNIFKKLIPLGAKLFNIGRKAAKSTVGQHVIKAAKRTALQSGLDLANDVLDGKSLKSSLKSRLGEAPGKFAKEVRKGGGGGKRSRKSSKTKKKKMTKKTGTKKKKKKKKTGGKKNKTKRKKMTTTKKKKKKKTKQAGKKKACVSSKCAAKKKKRNKKVAKKKTTGSFLV